MQTPSEKYSDEPITPEEEVVNDPVKSEKKSTPQSKKASEQHQSNYSEEEIKDEKVTPEKSEQYSEDKVTPVEEEPVEQEKVTPPAEKQVTPQDEDDYSVDDEKVTPSKETPPNEVNKEATPEPEQNQKTPQEDDDYSVEEEKVTPPEEKQVTPQEEDNYSVEDEKVTPSNGTPPNQVQHSEKQKVTSPPEKSQKTPAEEDDYSVEEEKVTPVQETPPKEDTPEDEKYSEEGKLTNEQPASDGPGAADLTPHQQTPHSEEIVKSNDSYDDDEVKDEKVTPQLEEHVSDEKVTPKSEQVPDEKVTPEDKEYYSEEVSKQEPTPKDKTPTPENEELEQEPITSQEVTPQNATPQDKQQTPYEEESVTPQDQQKELEHPEDEVASEGGDQEEKEEEYTPQEEQNTKEVVQTPDYEEGEEKQNNITPDKQNKTIVVEDQREEAEKKQLEEENQKNIELASKTESIQQQLTQKSEINSEKSRKIVVVDDEASEHQKDQREVTQNSLEDQLKKSSQQKYSRISEDVSQKNFEDIVQGAKTPQKNAILKMSQREETPDTGAKLKKTRFGNNEETGSSQYRRLQGSPYKRYGDQSPLIKRRSPSHSVEEEDTISGQGRYHSRKEMVKRAKEVLANMSFDIKGAGEQGGMFDDKEYDQGWFYMYQQIFQLPRPERFARVLEDRLVLVKKARVKRENEAARIAAAKKASLKKSKTKAITQNNTAHDVTADNTERLHTDQDSAGEHSVSRKNDNEKSTKNGGSKMNVAPKNTKMFEAKQVPDYINKSPQWKKMTQLEKELEAINDQSIKFGDYLRRANKIIDIVKKEAYDEFQKEDDIANPPKPKKFNAKTLMHQANPSSHSKNMFQTLGSQMSLKYHQRSGQISFKEDGRTQYEKGAFNGNFESPQNSRTYFDLKAQNLNLDSPSIKQTEASVNTDNVGYQSYNYVDQFDSVKEQDHSMSMHKYIGFADELERRKTGVNMRIQQLEERMRKFESRSNSIVRMPPAVIQMSPPPQSHTNTIDTLNMNTNHKKSKSGFSQLLMKHIDEQKDDSQNCDFDNEPQPMVLPIEVASQNNMYMTPQNLKGSIQIKKALRDQLILNQIYDQKVSYKDLARQILNKNSTKSGVGLIDPNTKMLKKYEVDGHFGYKRPSINKKRELEPITREINELRMRRLEQKIFRANMGSLDELSANLQSQPSQFMQNHQNFFTPHGVSIPQSGELYTKQRPFAVPKLHDETMELNKQSAQTFGENSTKNSPRVNETSRNLNDNSASRTIDNSPAASKTFLNQNSSKYVKVPKKFKLRQQSVQPMKKGLRERHAQNAQSPFDTSAISLRNPKNVMIQKRLSKLSSAKKDKASLDQQPQFDSVPASQPISNQGETPWEHASKGPQFTTMYDGGSMIKTHNQGFINTRNGFENSANATNSMIPRLPDVNEKDKTLAELSKSSGRNKTHNSSVDKATPRTEKSRVYLQATRRDRKGNTQVFKKSVDISPDHLDGIKTIISNRSSKGESHKSRSKMLENYISQQTQRKKNKESRTQSQEYTQEFDRSQIRSQRQPSNDYSSIKNDMTPVTPQSKQIFSNRSQYAHGSDLVPENAVIIQENNMDEQDSIHSNHQSGGLGERSIAQSGNVYEEESGNSSPSERYTPAKGDDTDEDYKQESLDYQNSSEMPSTVKATQKKFISTLDEQIKKIRFDKTKKFQMANTNIISKDSILSTSKQSTMKGSVPKNIKLFQQQIETGKTSKAKADNI